MTTRPYNSAMRSASIEQACLDAIRAADRRALAGDAHDPWLGSPNDPLGKRVASVWHDLGQIAGTAAPLRRPFQRRHNHWRQAAMLAAVLTVPIGALILADRPQVFETHVGERKTVSLADGSTITLNTDSHVEVQFSRTARKIDLDRGEAVFTVRADARRPFTVMTSHESVTAVGTAFQVRRDGDATEVTLIKGKIRLDSGNRGATVSHLIGSPGRFVRLASGTIAGISQVDPAATLAWRRGELVLDMTRLDIAVAEMNRYSTTKIVLASGLARGRQLTGIFKTGQSLPFARTVATLYGLSLTERSNTILLSDARQHQDVVR